jgi:hypothetical protein
MTSAVRKSFVYFAKGDKSGLIKIGYSTDPDKRCLHFGDRKDQGESGKVYLPFRAAPARKPPFTTNSMNTESGANGLSAMAARLLHQGGPKASQKVANAG